MACKRAPKIWINQSVSYRAANMKAVVLLVCLMAGAAAAAVGGDVATQGWASGDRCNSWIFTTQMNFK